MPEWIQQWDPAQASILAPAASAAMGELNDAAERRYLHRAVELLDMLPSGVEMEIAGFAQCAQAFKGVVKQVAAKVFVHKLFSNIKAMAEARAKPAEPSEP